MPKSASEIFPSDDSLDNPDFELVGEYLANRAVLDEIASMHPFESRMIVKVQDYDPDQLVYALTHEEFGIEQEITPEGLSEIVRHMAYYFYERERKRPRVPTLVDTEEIANFCISLARDDGEDIGPLYGDSGEVETQPVWLLEQSPKQSMLQSGAASGYLRSEYKKLTGTDINFTAELYSDYLESF